MALEDLARYESAIVAQHNLKERPDLALLAIEDFYNSKKELLSDPFVEKYLKRAFEDSQQNLKNGLGLATDLNNSAIVYGNKYEETFVKSKISDLVGYLSSGYNIPEIAKESIMKYKDLTFEELAKKAKDKETPEDEQKAIKKVIGAITQLKERKIQAIGLNVFNKYTTAMLDQLYPKPKEEKK